MVYKRVKTQKMNTENTNIKSVQYPDDYAFMKEVVRRRYKNAEWKFNILDLIVLMEELTDGQYVRSGS